MLHYYWKKKGWQLDLHDLLAKLACKVRKHFCFKFKENFANYWLIAGVPTRNESQAIDMLFEWLQAITTNITIKSQVIFLLLKLTEKYPELKNELSICLEVQMDLHTNDFEKRCRKVISQI